MSRLTDRLERDLREVAAGAHPSPSAWESIAARLDDHVGPEVEIVLASAPDRPKRPVWLAVAAALLVVTGSIVILTRPGDDRSISTADLTKTFVSPRNGFTIRHPNGAALTPATELWGFGKQVEDGFDVVETGLAAVFKGASATSRLAAGNWMDGWIDEYLERIDEYVSEDHGNLSGGCNVPRSQQAKITIDGQSGRTSECSNRIEATVVAGERLYLFILEHDRSDARAVFDAFVTTIDLTPETAVDLPGLTTTFVSPTNGYSFKHPHRVGLEPAKKLWDPVNQPSPIDDLGDAHYLDEFDVVETGLGYVFISASTQIPDEVSVDQRVDAAVIKYLPAGCYVPRRQQAPITIDGQSGRISANCPEDIVATVVVDGRLYLFMMAHGGGDATAFFDAWVDTIDLTPQTAAVP